MNRNVRIGFPWSLMLVIAAVVGWVDVISRISKRYRER